MIWVARSQDPTYYEGRSAEEMLTSEHIDNRHDLFVYLWKDRTTHNGLIDSHLLSFSMQFTAAKTHSHNYG